MTCKTQNVSQQTQTATEPPELPQYGPGSHPSFSQLMDAITLVLSKQSELEYKLLQLTELTERKIATLKKEQKYQIQLIYKLERRVTQLESYKRKRPFMDDEHIAMLNEESKNNA